MNLPSMYTQPVDHLENFEFSGDDFRVIEHSLATAEQKNGTGSPAKNSPDAEEHNTHLEDEMSDINSSKVWNPDTGMTADELSAFMSTSTVRHDGIREFDKFKDPNYKPARHLSWCIPEKCTCHLGPDVCHVGQKVTLERTNFDGDWYSISATPMQLEERGLGYTSVKYVLLNFSGQETSDAAINIDVTEIEEVADWFCSLAEKLKQQSDKPGLNL